MCTYLARGSRGLSGGSRVRPKSDAFTSTSDEEVRLGGGRVGFAAGSQSIRLGRRGWFRGLKEGESGRGRKRPLGETMEIFVSYQPCTFWAVVHDRHISPFRFSLYPCNFYWRPTEPARQGGPEDAVRENREKEERAAAPRWWLSVSRGRPVAHLRVVIRAIHHPPVCIPSGRALLLPYHAGAETTSLSHSVIHPLASDSR